MSSLPSGPASLKHDFSSLDQTKDIHNVLDSPISPSEIKITVKSLKPKKAPGPDKIRKKMLKTGIQVLNRDCPLQVV